MTNGSKFGWRFWLFSPTCDRWNSPYAAAHLRQIPKESVYPLKPVWLMQD